MKDFESKPFALIGVNTNGYTAEKLNQVMDHEKLSWRSFAIPDNKRKDGFVTDGWIFEGTPSLYVIDHKGVIRHKWLGSPGDKVLDQALAKLVKEAELGERAGSK